MVSISKRHFSQRPPLPLPPIRLTLESRPHRTRPAPHPSAGKIANPPRPWSHVCFPILARSPLPPHPNWLRSRSQVRPRRPGHQSPPPNANVSAVLHKLLCRHPRTRRVLLQSCLRPPPSRSSKSVVSVPPTSLKRRSRRRRSQLPPPLPLTELLLPPLPLRPRCLTRQLRLLRFLRRLSRPSPLKPRPHRRPLTSKRQLAQTRKASQRLLPSRPGLRVQLHERLHRHQSHPHQLLPPKAQP